MHKIRQHGRRVAVVASLTLMAGAAGIWSAAGATRIGLTSLKHGSYLAALPTTAGGETTAWSEGRPDRMAAGTTHWGSSDPHPGAVEKENLLLSWSSSDRPAVVAASERGGTTGAASWTAEALESAGAKLAPAGRTVVAWSANAPSTTAWATEN